MKTKYLLPRWCRTAGKVMLYLFLAMLLDVITFGKPGGSWLALIVSPEYLNMIVTPVLLGGLILLGFSPVKSEDEYTGRLRTSSFMISALANSVFIFIVVLLYNIWQFSDWRKDIPLENVFVFCLQMYVIAILAIYLIIFHIRLWCAAKSMSHEE